MGVAATMVNADWIVLVSLWETPTPVSDISAIPTFKVYAF
jgi:hypothetical protein